MFKRLALITVALIILGVTAMSQSASPTPTPAGGIGAGYSGLSMFPADVGTKVPEAADAYKKGVMAVPSDRKAAIGFFTKAIEIDPKFSAAYNHRGAALLDLNQIDDAIADFSKAIELDPKYITPYLNRGTAYLMYKEEYQKAVDDFTFLMKEDPDVGFYYTMRAQAYDGLGKKDLAAADRKRRAELRAKDH